MLVAWPAFLQRPLKFSSNAARVQPQLIRWPLLAATPSTCIVSLGCRRSFRLGPVGQACAAVRRRQQGLGDDGPEMVSFEELDGDDPAHGMQPSLSPGIEDAITPRARLEAFMRMQAMVMAETHEGIGAMEKELRFLAAAHHLADKVTDVVDDPHVELVQHECRERGIMVNEELKQTKELAIQAFGSGWTKEFVDVEGG